MTLNLPICPATGKKMYANRSKARKALEFVRSKRRLQGYPPHKIEKSFHLCKACGKFHLSRRRLGKVEARIVEEEAV